MLKQYIPKHWLNFFFHLPQAVAANIYYGWPSKQLQVIGVTGTDGKTTTTTGIYHILEKAGLKAGMVSTVKAAFEGKEVDTGFHVTTPDAWAVQKILKEMAGRKLDYLVLESTSHGLAQYRLWGIDFSIGVVTNVTHEHIDYHGSYENYLKAKAKLFDGVRYAILNQDDKSYTWLQNYIEATNPQAEIVTYGMSAKSVVRGTGIEITDKGISFTYSAEMKGLKKSGRVDLPLFGRYNAMNGLAMVSVALCLGIEDKKIVASLKSLPGIPGRMEVVERKPVTAIVDFAHTPNALESAIQAIKEHFLNKKGGRLFAVYGCAGLRDVEKRYLMGAVSGKLADASVLTAEDPRTEDVNKIIAMMAEGCKASGAREADEKAKDGSKARIFVRIPDRQAAISWAVAQARPGDVVAAFGKGHEQSMCFGTVEYPWSDQEAMRKALGVTIVGGK